MLHSSRGIALHGIKYSDHSLVATLLTEKFGKQTYLVKGAYRQKNGNLAVVLAHLNLLEMQVYHQSNRDLQSIKEIANIPAYTSIHSSHIKTSMVLFMAELLYRSIKDEQPDPPLFSFIWDSLLTFDLQPVGFHDFHLYFMLHLTKYLGFFPKNNFSNTNTTFDIRNGTFTSYRKDQDLIGLNDSRLLSQLIDTRLSDLNQLNLATDQRRSLLNLLAQYYQVHLHWQQPLKSLPVLQTIYE